MISSGKVQNISLGFAIIATAILLSNCCEDNEWSCGSGNCIDGDQVCDGTAQCPDGSDETSATCHKQTCPTYAYRCAYGACVPSSARCDGIKQCADNSDELSCEFKTRNTRNTVSPTTPASTVTCTAPNIPNSRLKYESDPTRIIGPGEKVADLSPIVYECLHGYDLEGPQFNLCFNGSWISGIHPTCSRYCPSEVLKGVTFNVRCIRDGAVVPCDNRIKSGTLANVNCRTKYRMRDQNPIQLLNCGEDGQWDYVPPRCEPICGEELIPSVPFVVNGEVTNITSAPWHVGIYRRFDDKYKHNCGGTIISAKIVISAAHCFWDNANKNLYDKSLFTVGARKYFRDYYTDESSRVQFQNISQISIPSEYNGESQKADIAALVLTNALEFSEFVSPICIQWERGAAMSTPDGLHGQVTVWGRDETGALSQQIRTIFVAANSYNTCKNTIEPQFADLLTVDKFCGINKSETNMGPGDSGGGFAVKKVIDGKSRYYLWGVISNKVPTGSTDNEIISFTNIQYFMAMVMDLEASNRPK